MSNDDNEWQLSKSVPITFVVGIFLQTIALVWYVSSLDNSIQNNEKELLRQDTRLNTVEQTVQAQALTLARIDENIKSIRIMMEGIASSKDPRQ